MFGGSPRIICVGREPFLIVRFSAGAGNLPGLKPILRIGCSFRWTEVQLPPAEAGGSRNK
jgi:hypothetical protein